MMITIPGAAVFREASSILYCTSISKIIEHSVMQSSRRCEPSTKPAPCLFNLQIFIFIFQRDQKIIAITAIHIQDTILLRKLLALKLQETTN